MKKKLSALIAIALLIAICVPMVVINGAIVLAASSGDTDKKDWTNYYGYPVDASGNQTGPSAHQPDGSNYHPSITDDGREYTQVGNDPAEYFNPPKIKEIPENSGKYYAVQGEQKGYFEADKPASTAKPATTSKPSGGGSSSGSSSGGSSSGSGGSGGGSSSGGGGSTSAPAPTPDPPPPPPPGFISVQSITPTSYQRWSLSTACVTVQNTGGSYISGSVSFTGPNLAGEGVQSRNVSLSEGQTATLMFNFLSPKEGTFTLTASADNSRSVDCDVTGEAYDPPDDSAAGNVITWTEEETHIQYIPTPDGDFPFFCTHYFTYQATLDVGATLTPSTLKAGYGFEVASNSSITVEQIAEGGDCHDWDTKPNALTPVPPAAAKVQLSWAAVSYKMKDRTTQTQPTTITLDTVSTSGSGRSWQAPQNNISETRLRKIYTHIDMRGTQSNPQDHAMTFKYTGGGIPERSLEWDTSLIKIVTINGVMFEDDHTGG